MVVGIFVAIKNNFKVDGVASMCFVVSLIVLAYSVLVYWQKFSPSKIEIDWTFWKPLIKAALPFGLSVVFITIFYWIDSVILSLVQGNNAVGVFSAAYRLMMVLLFIPTVVNIAIFPAMSRFYIASKDALATASNTYFRFMAIIAFPVGIGTTLLAMRIIC
jgi:O-antigen/teichoic acid export membrane protein